MKLINYAPDAFRLLNGFFCVYKPAGLFVVQVRKTLALNIARDLNCMETRPARDIVVFEGSVASGHPLSVKLVPSYADHPHVIGPRYQPQDVRLINANSLGKNTSGLLVFGVNDGCWKAKKFRQKSNIQVIEVKGKFGYATSDFFEGGKVIEKATYRHVRREAFNRTIAAIETSHQAEAYKYVGVPLDSQQAYELASKGPVRPEGKTHSILYNIQCTDFSLPHFTLKIHCISASEDYLCQLIHEVGIKMRSCAVCCQIRQIQFGHFTLDHALLRKHWTVEHLLNNTILCKSIFESSLLPFTSPHFKPVATSEIKQSVHDMQEDAKMDIM